MSKSAAQAGVKLVYGAAMLGRGIDSDEDVNMTLDALEAGGVTDIDTAQAYAGSEERLGKAKAGARFTIDTKSKGGVSSEQGVGTREEVIEGGKESLKKLGVDKVNTFYIHAPILDVPISSTLAGIQDLYLAGTFSNFGLSNYTAEGVEEVYNHCKEQGYVLPSVYQGNYSAVTRKLETDLIPTLRRLGIAFYAYSPIAGGFLTKTEGQVLEGAGRFAPPGQGTLGGGLYHSLYVKPAYLDVLEEWGRIAEAAGCSKADLAYRWVKFHSVLRPELGDAVIFGASKVEQIRQTLNGVEAGPLEQGIADRIDAIWKLVEKDAPVDNFNSFIKPAREAR